MLTIFTAVPHVPHKFAGFRHPGEEYWIKSNSTTRRFITCWSIVYIPVLTWMNWIGVCANGLETHKCSDSVELIALSFYDHNEWVPVDYVGKITDHCCYLATSICIPKCILASAPTTNELTYIRLSHRKTIILSSTFVRLMCFQINMESIDNLSCILGHHQHKNEAKWPFVNSAGAYASWCQCTMPCIVLAATLCISLITSQKTRVWRIASRGWYGQKDMYIS